MLETATDGRVALLFLVVAGITACLAAQLAVSRSRVRLRFRARCLLVFLASALLLLVTRVAVLGQLLFSGRPGSAERLGIVLVFVVVPAVAVLAWSVPRIWRVTRGVVVDPWGPTDAAVRAQASAPRLVVPVLAMAFGAALAPFRSLFPAGFPPLAVVAALGALLLAIITTLWAWQRRRSQALGTPSLSYAEEIRFRRILETRRATL